MVIAILGASAGLTWSQQAPAPDAPHAVPATNKEILDLLKAQTAAIKAIAARVTELEHRVQVLESQKAGHREQ
jgi:hypothetical protein